MSRLCPIKPLLRQLGDNAYRSAVTRKSSAPSRSHSRSRPLAVLAGDHPEAVVLDFVQPQVAGSRGRADVGRHGAMKPAGTARESNNMGQTDRFRAVRSMWRPRYATTLCAAIIDS
jgi:hypothetical protein